MFEYPHPRERRWADTLLPSNVGELVDRSLVELYRQSALAHGATGSDLDLLKIVGKVERAVGVPEFGSFPLIGECRHTATRFVSLARRLRHRTGPLAPGFGYVGAQTAPYRVRLPD